MHLHARAVDLVLDRRATEPCDRVARALGGLREHRLHGPEDLERERREPRRAVGQRRARDAARITAQHERSAHRRRVDAAGLRDRLRQHALERSLPQLADQEPREELLLVGGRAGEQRAQNALSCRARPAAGGRRDLLERPVDVDERQRRIARRLAAHAGDRGPADPRPPLPDATREI